ncbi:hypothetical protein BsIDN1_04630 [Bacillus safensis]|uniref:Uncharacterized protein n=1 Tax=Bacillus safensis TaxID=561879 RepID=A0A5S9M258_BACIA|nr:hypothetical protein BsIDN1_04630 [Bacillus safensis]
MNTLQALLNDRMERSSQIEAVTGGGVSYTFEEYAKRIDQLAHYLHQKKEFEKVTAFALFVKTIITFQRLCWQPLKQVQSQFRLAGSLLLLSWKVF